MNPAWRFNKTIPQILLVALLAGLLVLFANGIAYRLFHHHWWTLAAMITIDPLIAWGLIAGIRHVHRAPRAPDCLPIYSIAGIALAIGIVLDQSATARQLTARAAVLPLQIFAPDVAAKFEHAERAIQVIDAAVNRTDRED